MVTLALTPTPFIGRSQETDELGALLDNPDCRLLTLVGPGGIGKTRLAMEVATRKCESFTDGMYFVQLAPLTRAEDILNAIVEATPFRFQQDKRSPSEQFFDYLRQRENKRLLFILDNFEHLLEGVDIVSEILATTTNVKIIVTSRETLNLQEEWVRQIAGMAYPERENGTPLEDYSAIQLFLDRARRIHGDFDLVEDRRNVIEICRLVEGMPLAIELAAGWLKTLKPADIVQEIQHNMDILATRSRNLPERHRSIRSVFSQSWGLMSENERDIFQKLSVFRGGFTREAAEVVAGASLHTLAGLVDKSLVRLSATGRYDVHELLRQYGAEQMDAANQTAATQRAYIEYTLGLLHRLERDIKAHHQIEALNTIAANIENVRHAWQLAIEQQHYDAINGAVESLQFFGDMRGRYHEVVAMLRAAIEKFPYPANHEHATILYRIQARFIRLIMLGNLPIDFEARAQIEKCLAEARARQDQPEVGFCLLVLGIVVLWEVYARCSAENSEPFFQESYRVYTALDDTFYRAEALVWFGSAKNDSGDTEIDGDTHMQSLELRRKIGDRNGIAWITLNLTHIEALQLDYVECERYAREALTLMREIGSIKGILQALFKLAQMTMLKGALDEARILAEQLRDLADETNNLDGKMLTAGLLSFLLAVMEERYVESVELAQINHVISQMPFFGEHDDLSARWGQALSDCGLGRYEDVRTSYPSLFWERFDNPAPAAICLVLEAAVRAHEGAPEEAVELLSLAFHQPTSTNGWMQHWAFLKRLRADLMLQLGQDVYQQAWERGARHDLLAAVQSFIGEANAYNPPVANQSLLEPLSVRELEVLRLIANGMSNRDIAERLVLSVGTVKVHTRNIYGKLNVGSRTQAIAEATKLNLLVRN
jgi:predicted ATPase/DNA-binding CsgD family transcriptional regulator